MPDLEQLRYPVGRFDAADGAARRATRAAPASTRSSRRRRDSARSSTGVRTRELDTPYRPDGWTVRQVVHHVPDSHMNAYIRMKFAVTEESPAIKAYEEARWAELPEAKTGPADMSLALLESLHRRWVAFLRALPADRVRRASTCTRSSGRVTLDEAIAMYAWHCRHHAAHIEGALALGVSSGPEGQGGAGAAGGAGRYRLSGCREVRAGRRRARSSTASS